MWKRTYIKVCVFLLTLFIASVCMGDGPRRMEGIGDIGDGGATDGTVSHPGEKDEAPGDPDIDESEANTPSPESPDIDESEVNTHSPGKMEAAANKDDGRKGEEGETVESDQRKETGEPKAVNGITDDQAVEPASVPNENGSPEITANIIEPLFVRELTAVESGHNDSNPVWSYSGERIAFERSIGDKKKIIIARADGTIEGKIYYRSAEDKGEMDFFFPGIFEEISYNAGISWSPSGKYFVFMSNGGSGNYDLYLHELAADATVRLTKEERKDGQPHWSAVSDKLVFVSGRTGKADVFLMDIFTRDMKRLTFGDRAYLYPQWSPDGKKIAMIYGSNENHDIYIINDVAHPAETTRAITSWSYDDLRPVWSPDGKKIAFYTNFNSHNDPRVWSIAVVESDGSGPAEGEGLAAKVVAMDVVPDIEKGPAWLPDGGRIIYVKNDRHKYNPIYIVDIDKKTDLQLKTDTKMNHDVTCAANGNIAFRSQVEQWDHIYIAKLSDGND